ncbi:uncharacterized protein C8Q71DRAFT_856996 [Rhodofomes roseus]|uniref:SMP domain-containing protein n=1 Tax=Rhodofomes roseus TaxID=34475 RepID=A0ABQ8KIJ3_9APHY|nr:uncharacterized protein C8Q71DRAFT_856996 [Rhodofomes roseus]KAH9837815.1 hypothetical protein C8Q71DRAFT_856996 [Rhodofomes roseus]
MSHNAGSVMFAAHQDATRFAGAGHVDLKNIGEAEARKLMSAEHKALGYRPPPGSLAATAQAEAAKHPDASADIPEQALEQAAIEDATRIQSLKSIDVDQIESEEHRALGYRPPPGSLASQAQAASAKHPDASSGLPSHELKRAAIEDAAQIAKLEGERGVPLSQVGIAEASKLMSGEHKALGYRPPPGSLAAKAQAAATNHPDASAGIETAALTKAAVEDARAIETRRQETVDANGTAVPADVNVNTTTADEAHALQSEEHKTLGYRPPTGSLTAQAQSGVDKRAQEPVTKELAAEIQGQEHKAVGHLPESGSLAATAQSLADKNANDGGDRTLGDVGL